MINVEKIVTPSPAQWEIIIEGMRNAMNSWDKMDSFSTYIEDPETLNTADFEFFMGEEDERLATSLASKGPVHGKFLRMIPIYMTINAPLYWWKEYDTYKVGTVTNSCSTMHKIHSKEFTFNDFSCEHLFPFLEDGDIDRDLIVDIKHSDAKCASDLLSQTIFLLNHYRDKYNETKNKPMKDEKARKKLMKKYWHQMIQLLPTSYNQKRTLFLNYEVLRNIYIYRKEHKLNEWRELCKIIETLPYAHLITGEKRDEN